MSYTKTVYFTGALRREGGARGWSSVLPLCHIKKSVSPAEADADWGVASRRGEVAKFILWRLFSTIVEVLNCVTML